MADTFIAAIGRQRQVDLSAFEASLLSIASSRLSGLYKETLTQKEKSAYQASPMTHTHHMSHVYVHTRFQVSKSKPNNSPLNINKHMGLNKEDVCPQTSLLMQQNFISKERASSPWGHRLVRLVMWVTEAGGSRL